MRDDNALAGRQSVRLYDHRIIEVLECIHRGGSSFHPRESGRGDSYPLHEFLRVDLAAFKLGLFLGWSEYGPAGDTELVHDTRDQRSFWPNNGEIHPERYRGCKIVGGRNELAHLSDSRIARSGKDLMAFLREPPGECMLAAAASDDKNPQGKLPV